MLKRFFSPIALIPILLEEEGEGRGRTVVVTGVRVVLGVAATFLAPTGLLVACRLDAVEGCVVVRLAGVAAADFVVGVRSEEADGASDILLGFAEMPSLLFSSPEGFSSTVLSEPLFL